MRCREIAILVLFSFLLGGCWDKKELNELTVVIGMAIDKGEKKLYKLTVETLNPSELTPKKGTSAAPSIGFSLEGDTISEISHKLNVGMSRKLIYSHMRTVYISEEIARTAVLEFLDYMERDREIRDDFNMLLVRGVRAADAMAITYPLQKVPSLKVHTQLQSMVQEWGGDPDVRMRDVISALTSDGREAVAVLVGVKGDPKTGNKLDNNKSITPPAILTVQGMGVFKGQKLIGYLNMEDIRSYMWTQNKLVNTTLTIPCGKKKNISARIFHSITHTKARYENGKPIIRLNIYIEARLDSIQCKEDLTKIKTYKKLEKSIEAAIEKQITATVQKVQTKYQSDIFGFGEEMMRQDYQNYKKVRSNWDKEFTRAKVIVDAYVRLRRTGIRGKSYITELK